MSTMALVSYVDILEVVGELKDFKVKLVEGEGIVKKGGITGLFVKEREKGIFDISASCQSTQGEHTPYVISISIIGEPRLLDCKCSCQDGRSGKCQHVVATLMHIHRNNVSLDTLSPGLGLETSGEKQCPISCTSGEGINQDDLGSVTSNCDVTPNNNISSTETYILPDDTLEVANHETNTRFTSTQQNPFSYKNIEEASINIELETKPVEDIRKIAQNSNCADQRDDLMEVQSKTEKRMGRGQRRSIPNPKYSTESKKFICDVCAKGFGKKAHYEEHLRSHTGEKPFACDVCGQRYSQKRSLLKHKEAGKKGGCRAKKILKCHTCDSSFKTQSELDVHLKCHSINSDFTCPECGKSFLLKEDLDVHQILHTKISTNSSVNMDAVRDNVFMCDVCGKGFKKLAHLTQHKKTHTEEKPFKCLECGKSFSRQRTFKAHKHVKQEDKSSDSVTALPVPRKRVVINCETCGKEFTNRVHHEEHVRSHTGERPFQCVECGKCFATKRSLRNHSHAGKDARSRPHMCSQCPATFTTGFMLKIHERGHTGERPYECAECGKSYRSQHIYQDHLNHHKGIKAHICKECGKSFTWRTSLWAHSRDHAKEKPFECVQCGAKFHEQSELKDHWAVHLDDKPFQCPECGLGFLVEADCDKHVEIHKKNPSYSCSKCSKSFLLAAALNRHMTTHKEKKRSLCPTCGQTFSSKGHLKVHMMIHTGEKPFECEFCRKRFYTRSLMRKHAVFHSHERPFDCVLCGDKFPTQGILRAHIRTHTGEKPFSCDVCGKAFPQSSYLKRHKLTHSGDRPFPCSDCGNAFVSRYDLKVHMRTHTGDKPYSCDECNEQFYERAQLTAHLRLHTGERPYICDLCGKGFNSSNHIKKHFGRVHPDVAPFYCNDCGERFMMCETLRKHRKSTHLSATDFVDPLEHLSDSSQEETVDDPPAEEKKDPLNRLIEDSQILVEEMSNSSCGTVNGESASVLTQEYEIVQVNLVDSSELMKLPEGYRCEAVEVYHAETLEDFEGKCQFQAVSITPLSDKIDAPSHADSAEGSETELDCP